MLLLAGGARDPNLQRLLARADERGLPTLSLLVGSGASPRLTWDLASDRLWLEDRPVEPTAVFLRSDVFEQLADPRPEVGRRALGWFTTLQGWALAHPRVRLLNRGAADRWTNKPRVLHLARRLGLEVPLTRVTNDLQRLRPESETTSLVVKPVMGGDYCRDLAEVLRTLEPAPAAGAMPALVQPRLVPPEVRIYGIAGRFLAFTVESSALDYRTADDTRLHPLPPNRLADGLLAALGRLMDQLDLDFAAADFKSHPDDGRLRFLEINSAPMFTAFDEAAEGALGDALLDALTPS